MKKVAGYKQVSFDEFIVEMNAAYALSSKTHFSISNEINVSSVQTSANAFRNTDQIVSDSVMTKVANAIGLKCVILWDEGNRLYYIKSK